MSKQSFENLLEKYSKGLCDPREKRLVEQWFELIDKEPEPVSQKEWLLYKKQIWQKIQSKTEEEGIIQNVAKRSLYKYYFAAAASVVLILGFFLFRNTEIASKNEITKTETKDGTEWKNSSLVPHIVHLPDGSHVRLQPHSKLIAPIAFANDKREIKLEGDAFFDVAHDPKRPFLITVGNVVTRVVGTSFWIYKHSNQSIEVAVRTGKVSVSEKETKTDKSNGVLLTPNQKAVYFSDNQHFVVGLVDKPEIIKNEQNDPPSFSFNNTPLITIVEKLEKAYGIQLIIENENLKNCNITGQLDNLEMFDKLNVICESLRATYEIQGTSILISGKGCE